MTQPVNDTTRARLDVDPALLTRMGPAVKGSKSLLSPFRQDVASLSDDDRAMLTKIGALDSTGGITAINARALSQLASAQRVTRVQLAGSDGIFEYVVYFAGGKGEPVSLKTVGDALRIEDPAATADAFAYLTNMIGSSIVVGTEFSESFPIPEAAVFAALVDESRRSHLRSLADGKRQERALDAHAIATSMGERSGAFLTIASLVRGVAGTIPPQEIEAALEGLVHSGHARRKGKGMVVTEAGAGLARSFLNIDSVLRLTAGRQGSDRELDHVTLTCGIAGLHDILSVERVGSRVHLETLTSRRLLDMIHFFLTVEEALPPRITNGAGFCGHCGRKRSAGDRFCPGCGTALSGS